MKSSRWFLFTLLAMIFWGVWGAFIEIPEKAGFPATLGYVVWALTMLVPALIGLKIANWKLDKSSKAITYGVLIGITGAVGQLVLFQALILGPAYLVFPFVSLSPLITIVLSFGLLKEKASLRSGIGIILALAAMPLLSYQPSDSTHNFLFLWMILALIVFLMWGTQAYFIKVANKYMTAESIFFYMMITAIAFIPIAIWMTDFKKDINWRFNGPYISFFIQILNSVGALFLVYAFRNGRAIVVSPLINAGAPVITIVLSLIIYGVFPHPLILTGMLLAVIAIILLAE